MTRKIWMVSPKREESQGWSWPPVHISVHHWWPSAGPSASTTSRSPTNLFWICWSYLKYRIISHIEEMWRKRSSNVTWRCPASFSPGQSAPSTCPPPCPAPPKASPSVLITLKSCYQHCLIIAVVCLFSLHWDSLWEVAYLILQKVIFFLGSSLKLRTHPPTARG